MKEIFQEYGAAIIAVITGVLLLGVIFGIRHADKTGLFSIMGLSVEKQETDYTAYRDFDAVQVWHEREKPQVYYVEEKGRYFADETCGFLERYYAKDMEGALYSMNLVMLENRYPDVMFGSISDIRDAEGNSRMSYYNAANGKIRFQEPGVYEVYFRVIDRENIEETWKIPIAVDEGPRCSPGR